MFHRGPSAYGTAVQMRHLWNSAADGERRLLRKKEQKKQMLAPWEELRCCVKTCSPANMHPPSPQGPWRVQKRRSSFAPFKHKPDQSQEVLLVAASLTVVTIKPLRNSGRRRRKKKKNVFILPLSPDKKPVFSS